MRVKLILLLVLLAGLGSCKKKSDLPEKTIEQPPPPPDPKKQWWIYGGGPFSHTRPFYNYHAYGPKTHRQIINHDTTYNRQGYYLGSNNEYKIGSYLDTLDRSDVLEIQQYDFHE